MFPHVKSVNSLLKENNDEIKLRRNNHIYRCATLNGLVPCCYLCFDLAKLGRSSLKLGIVGGLCWYVLRSGAELNLYELNNIFFSNVNITTLPLSHELEILIGATTRVVLNNP